MSKPEEIDPVGCVVYVTGDDANFEHGFKPGAKVTIVQDTYFGGGNWLVGRGPAGDYECEDADGIAWWVAAVDLA